MGVSEHVASNKSFPFFNNENILSACLGFCFAIEIDIAFLHSNFRSIHGLLLEHCVTTLIYSSPCIFFLSKYLQRPIASGEYLNTRNANEHLVTFK